MVEIKPPFYLDENYNDETLSLLESVTLGSNGARYRHVGIPARIKNLYNPLYLNLRLRDKLIANVTFCRRNQDWYVRYFAFDTIYQASRQQTKAQGGGKIKSQLNDFFDRALSHPKGPGRFYAYIDPKNERSLWMSETFGFETVAMIKTQTFSRSRPKQKNVHVVTNQELIQKWVTRHFGDRPYFHPYQTYNSTPFYTLEKKGKVVGFAKVHYANWKIEQLPGKNGRLLTRIIPFLPIINRLIKPRDHQFLTLDTVWIENNNPSLLNELFEGILFQEKKRIIHWWVDQKEPLYRAVQQKVNWGLIHQINGAHDVSLVVRSNKQQKINSPVYVSGFDFI